jgi:hypothetical protein
MTDTPMDTMDLARRELAANMMPSPEDMFDELGPVAVLFFTEQTLVECYKHFVVDLGAPDPDVVDTSQGPGKALVAIGQALGMIDAACVELGILPPEAIER